MMHTMFLHKKKDGEKSGSRQIEMMKPILHRKFGCKNIPGSNQQGWDLTKKKDHWPGKNSRLSQKKLHLSRQNWWSLQLIKVLNIFPPATLVAFGSRSNSLLQFTMEPQIVGESHFWWFRNPYPRNNGWIFWMTIFLPLVHSDVLSCSLYLANAWKKRPSQGTLIP